MKGQTKIFYRYKKATDRFERACQRYHALTDDMGAHDKAVVVREYMMSREVYRELTSLVYDLDLDDAYLTWLDGQKMKEAAR